jgi:Dynamin GTPase effector domain
MGENTAMSINEQMAMEVRPFTQNVACLRRIQDALFRRLKAYREAESNTDYEIELKMIANVLGYTHLASVRIADIIPMRVEQNFQHNLAFNISRQLLATFLIGEDQEEKCSRFLEESPEVAARRRELNSKTDILRVAEQELRKFQLIE